ncbi:MAG: hypothetical protein U9R02_00130 [Thermodesulfobacteriota bacterium]|nr:hypothetical protein [Thermodesulfobacteriota bacterium]
MVKPKKSEDIRTVRPVVLIRWQMSWYFKRKKLRVDKTFKKKYDGISALIKMKVSKFFPDLAKQLGMSQPQGNTTVISTKQSKTTLTY